MLKARARWTKLGRILEPDAGRDWMATYTGASFAVPRPDDDVVDVFVTGRDSRNRSRIGVITKRGPSSRVLLDGELLEPAGFDHFQNS